MPKGPRAVRALSARARPYSLSPASDEDELIDDPPVRSHRPRHESAVAKRVTVRKTPEQVKALNVAFEQLGARPSQLDRRRLALDIGLSERIVNTWFRDERSKRKKEGIAASRAAAAAPSTATATPATLIMTPSMSAKARVPMDDEAEDRETEIDEDSDMEDHPPQPHLLEHQPTPRKLDNNRPHDVPVVTLPGPSTPYRGPVYHLAGCYPEQTDLAVAHHHHARTPSVPQQVISPPLAVQKLTGAAAAAHLSPASAPSEIWSSASEHDGERIFDAPRSRTYSPLTTHLEPSPIRSEASLPATPLNGDTELPLALPPAGARSPPPPEGGWTSSWRWSFYGHTSQIRTTLEPAKWTPPPDSQTSSDAESILGLQNLTRVTIRVSDYDHPFDGGKTISGTVAR